MDRLSSQGSRPRLLRPASTPSLPSLNPPTITPSDFLRSFQRINHYVSLAQRAAHFDHLKRVQIQPIAEEQYVKAIKHLENAATKPRFVSEYVTLQPWKVAMGFLEEGQYQYFTVNLKGNVSPLNVAIQKSRGIVETFFSYASLKPGPDIYDFHSRASSFKIEGKFTRFRENSGCLCVLAVTDCTFAIIVTFGEEPPGTEEEEQKPQTVQMNRTLPNTFEMANLEELLEDISTAPSLTAVNHIRLNKRITPIHPNYSQQKVHRHLVRMRQIYNYHQKQERVREQAERNSRRLAALKQANYVSSVLQRKAKFEKMWLGLIYFACASNEAYSRFQIDKQQSIRDTKVYLTAYRLQQAYKKRQHDSLPLSQRLILSVKNHLKMYISVKNHHFGDEIKEKLGKIIKESRFLTVISRKTEDFLARIMRIQRNWRIAKSIEGHYFLHLSKNWDFVLKNFISKQEESRKRKKNKKKSAKHTYVQLSEIAKKRIIQQVYAEAVKKWRLALSLEKGIKRYLCEFLPKLEEIKRVVKLYARQETV